MVVDLKEGFERLGKIEWRIYYLLIFLRKRRHLAFSFQNNTLQAWDPPSFVRFFSGTSGEIVVLHSSLSSFVASTRLMWSGVGAIDSPDQFRQGSEQNDTFEVLESFLGEFLMACRQKFSFFVFSRLV